MASRENARRRLGPGQQDSARSAALEQLRSLKQKGGRRIDSFELKVDDKIYDSLPEKDYALLVAKRRLESKDFVVEDDGLGYGDIGEEENWDVGGLPHQKQKSADSRKKDMPRKKERELMAAAALMGKQNVSSMFAAASGATGARTAKAGNCDGADSVLDDVLAAVGAGDLDRERRKHRRTGITSQQHSAVQHQFPSVSFGIGILNPGPELDVQQDNDGISMMMSEMEIPPTEEVKEGMSTVAMPKIETELKENAPESANEPVTISMHAEQPDRKVTFNAKFAGPSMEQQACTAWQAIRASEERYSKPESISEDVDVSGDAASVPVDQNGNLLFFLIDAYEEAFGANTGTIFLFGKVQRGGKYISCCVVVRNMQRCIFAVPGPKVFPDNIVSSLEQQLHAQDSSGQSLKAKLQELAKDLKMELGQKLMELNVTKFSMIPVKRSYAFERPDVHTGAHYVMKLSYPFKDPPLPSNLKGEHFSTLFGTHNSALEMLLIKKKIKAPCWLSITNPLHCPTSTQISWCKLEVAVDCPKNLTVAPPGMSPSEFPKLTVASINLKTIVNQKQNLNEIIGASVVSCEGVKIDAPMPQSEWNKHEMLGHFSIIRKLDGGVYPMGFITEVTEINSKAGSTVLSCESSERALLNRLMTKLYQLDPDVLVGHNISAFDLDVLLHRLQACKVPWSRVGRLKRSLMPRLTGGGGTFGGGAGPGAMACVAGRLLCDTYLSSRELLKEVSYTLTQLSKSQLGKERKEIAPSEIPMMYQTSTSLLELVETAETDAWLSLSLMFHLSILPLTRQLTNVSGNLWSKTLQGARAQRVEYLLLHEFHSRKFILPDKLSSYEKDQIKQKRKGKYHGDIEGGELGLQQESEPEGQRKRKKSPAYMGGLVLEPKKGLYDKYVLLLDFNSLYPSIIQEYNICFTTVERPSDGSIPSLPSADTPGVLPQVLKSLVDRRRQVKQWLKNTTDVLKYQQLDIQQQALKLTANSMYGCLGFPNSRFYAKSIAELITSQGREILQSTVDLVQNVLNLEVIYGDTDSIMINTGLDDLLTAKSIGAKVIKEVNKKYKLLEIDLDGVFKRMLLLKKKKYASVKVERNGDGTYREVIEQKGLDIVRRDWSLLSKEIGNFILEQILSGGSLLYVLASEMSEAGLCSSREDVVDAIHNQLRKLQDDMRSGRIEVEKYVITKSLTKPPEDYPDGKNQPHVQVALRRKQRGHKCFPGDTVPYVICCEEGSSGVPIAERARHPEELKEETGNWMIDIDYYLSQQIHPVVSRLCAPIEGTDPSHIASCLGLDTSKFQQRTMLSTSDREEALISASILDDDDRYKRCEPLELLCPSCVNRYPFPGVSSVLNSSTEDHPENVTVDGQASLDNPLRCPSCSNGQSQAMTPSMLANQVTERATDFIERFYDCWMVCDDEMCNHTTRDIILRVVGDTEKGCVCPNFPRCNGRLVRQYTQVDLYNQLTYFCRLLDVTRAIEKTPEVTSRLRAEKKLLPLRAAVDLAAQTIKEIRDRCTFRWVQMSNLCVTL